MISSWQKVSSVLLTKSGRQAWPANLAFFVFIIFSGVNLCCFNICKTIGGPSLTHTHPPPTSCQARCAVCVYVTVTPSEGLGEFEFKGTAAALCVCVKLRAAHTAHTHTHARRQAEEHSVCTYMLYLGKFLPPLSRFEAFSFPSSLSCVWAGGGLVGEKSIGGRGGINVRGMVEGPFLPSPPPPHSQPQFPHTNSSCFDRGGEALGSADGGGRAQGYQLNLPPSLPLSRTEWLASCLLSCD